MRFKLWLKQLKMVWGNKNKASDLGTGALFLCILYIF